MTTLAPQAYGSGNEDQSWKIVVSTAVSFALVLTGLTLRLASRWLCRKRLEANDYLIIAAFFPKLGLDVASIMLIVYGIGKHVTTLSPESITNYLKVLYVGSFLYAPTIAFIKLSILALYWSAFPSKFIRRSCIVLGTIIMAWGIACCLVGLLACLPIRKAWTPTIPGTCIDTHRYYYGLQIPNIVTDFAMLFLPFKPIWDLHLPTKQKVLMSGVFCLALVTCAFDIVRLVVLIRLPNGGDFTWNQVQASVWTDLEPSMAYLIACLPIAKPLFSPRESWRRRQASKSDSSVYTDIDSDYKDSNSHHAIATYNVASK